MRSNDYPQKFPKDQENDKAQKSWQTVERIKDLKAGYLSQVVHVLTQLMIKYNAVICLEDLNSGFMRGRQKVDKSVYQQFEQKLITKLQYLADKKIDADQPLGILRGIQLTNSDVSRKGTQNGVIFYIPAWCTSKIDPVTGFVNLFDVRNLRYENVNKTRNFFSKFQSIVFNAKKDYFEFSFDYADFNGNAEGTRSRWTVCSFGDRIRTCRSVENGNRWEASPVHLTEEFKKLFSGMGILLDGDLKNKIVSVQDCKPFWESLLYLFRLTLQMRNSMPNSTDPQDDYLLSPVCDERGVFFDTRKAGDDMPGDADANGAYNIARKGLWQIQQIRAASDTEEKLPVMTKKDWLNFVQK